MLLGFCRQIEVLRLPRSLAAARSRPRGGVRVLALITLVLQTKVPEVPAQGAEGFGHAWPCIKRLGKVSARIRVDALVEHIEQGKMRHIFQKDSRPKSTVMSFSAPSAPEMYFENQSTPRPSAPHPSGLVVALATHFFPMSSPQLWHRHKVVARSRSPPPLPLPAF